MPHTADDVTLYLHTHIPMTRHMGVRVVGLDDASIRLITPLAPNLNHRETAFGGSLASVAIVAGWTLIHVKLSDHGFRGRLVVQRSTVEFLEPVEEDFETICSFSDVDDWDRFYRTLTRKGKARLALNTESRVGGRTAAIHEGVYVAIALR